MKSVILYMAISTDGFIAGPNSETPWSSEEWQAYREFVKSCDACLIGSATYEVMKNSNEFIESCRYIVATHNTELDTGEFEKVDIQSSDDMPDVEKLGVFGGGELNGALMKLGTINEIILDIEPVILGNGVRLLGSHNVTKKIKLLSSKLLNDNTLQNHYEVIK